jgi:hypothetical protein
MFGHQTHHQLTHKSPTTGALSLSLSLSLSLLHMPILLALVTIRIFVIPVDLYVNS